MSTLAVVECDQKDCKSNDDGYCAADWIEVRSQECMTYSCADLDYGDEGDE